MKTADIAATEQLAEEKALFVLIGRLLHGMPDRELLTRVVDERLFELIPFVDEIRAREAHNSLVVWMDDTSSPLSSDDFETIRVEYARLFVGARKVAAPLWESVYFNRERMVFQEQTLDARRAYEAYGLEVERYRHEPDDHLASELLFVAHLAHQVLGHLEPDDRSRFQIIMADQHKFSERHLFTWVSDWRDLVLARTSNGLYRGLAMLVVQACEEAHVLAGTLARQFAWTTA